MIEYKKTVSIHQGLSYGLEVMLSCLPILVLLPLLYLLTVKIKTVFRLIAFVLIYLLTALWANCMIFETRVAAWSTFSPREIFYYIVLYHQAFAVISTVLFYTVLRLLYRYIFEYTSEKK
jgi:hypothetical protein